MSIGMNTLFLHFNETALKDVHIRLSFMDKTSSLKIYPDENDMAGRVFFKKQSSFLWPTHLNQAVSVCKEIIYQKSDFYVKNWPSAAYGFDFGVFEGEIGQKWAKNSRFLKFAWNSP